MEWIMMGIFGIGMQELIVILIICLLLFGASKLPELAKSLGKAVKEFKKAGKDIEKDLEETDSKESKPH